MLKQDGAALVSADDGEHYEIVNGVRRELEPMGAFESSLASILVYYLGPFLVERKLGLAVTETLFLLDAQKDLRRRPDVAFVSYSRWSSRTVPRESAWNVVPDLAVEIVSPTNTAEEIDGKITEYFQAGVRLVWVIYPDSGRVYVYRSPTHVRGLERSAELDGEDVLPGFRLPIEKLYELVTRPEG